MNPIRAVGLVVLIAGVVVQPLGWMYVQWLTMASFVAIVLGVILLIAWRERQVANAGRANPRTAGREMPGDIHGHSGQMSGGRSTSWKSQHSGSESEASD
jgi:hypothetical protein